MVRLRLVRAKAVSPLRSTTALQNATAWFGCRPLRSKLQNFLNRSEFEDEKEILNPQIRQRLGDAIDDLRQLRMRLFEIFDR
jgi:hypothetical protein